MGWRPDDWVSYCGSGFKFGGWTCPDEEIRQICAGIYEAGADAMLRAIRKELVEMLLDAKEEE